MVFLRVPCIVCLALLRTPHCASLSLISSVHRWSVACDVCERWSSNNRSLVLLRVAKMPFVFSHVEYCDMHFVYGFCNGNAVAAVEEYRRSFPDSSICTTVGSLSAFPPGPKLKKKGVQNITPPKLGGNSHRLSWYYW